MSRVEPVPPGIEIREDLMPGDMAQIDRILEATAMFYPHEIQVALELVEEGLRLGRKTSYRFLIAENGGEVFGYACFGMIPCTDGSYDLYWIAVRPDLKRQGIGRLLLDEAEQRAKAAGARRIFIDTASRSAYAPTHAFYLSCGYEIEARLRDFYAAGDDKLIFAKAL